MTEKKIRAVDSAKYLWGSLSSGVQTLAKFISACGMIIGILAAGLGWATNQITAGVNEQLQAMQSMHSEDITELKKSTTRIELQTLINDTPENIAEIERVARYYFRTLNGDWYMTGIYSKWAKQYGGDVSFVISD